MDKLLTLEEVILAFDNIVKADPTFVYPQQGEIGIDGADDRCKCVEIYDEVDEGLPRYDFSDCPWHFNDDNTCLYLKDGSSHPACVVGHYFVDVLDLKHVYLYETQSPQRVLDGHGYEVAPRAQRFLNTIQSAQDHGYSWGEAYAQAQVDAEGPQ